MYLNTFLYQFGLDPDNFENELVEPFESDDGFIIYNLRQRIDERILKMFDKAFPFIPRFIFPDICLHIQF